MTEPEELQGGGCTVLNIYPDSNVISMRSEALLTVEGHATE